MTSGEVSCLVDSATIPIILRQRRYISNLIPNRISLTTISGSSNLIKGHETSRLLLSNGTEFTIKKALFSPCSGRTLLSFKDMREKNYHAEIIKENGMKYLYITSYLTTRSVFWRK